MQVIRRATGGRQPAKIRGVKVWLHDEVPVGCEFKIDKFALMIQLVP